MKTTFMGYPRPDGGVGIRNFVAVISTVSCANLVAERIARVHGCELMFRSRKGEGTRVSFCLDCEKGGTEDEEDED